MSMEFECPRCRLFQWKAARGPDPSPSEETHVHQRGPVRSVARVRGAPSKSASQKGPSQTFISKCQQWYTRERWKPTDVLANESGSCCRSADLKVQLQATKEVLKSCGSVQPSVTINNNNHVTNVTDVTNITNIVVLRDFGSGKS
jgi:hypothetical protein